VSKTLRIPLRKHPGIFFLVDDNVWAEYLREGFSKNPGLDSNGSRHSYVRPMVWLPDPSWLRSIPIGLARIIVAIHAHLSGNHLASKGWTVRHKNGNHLDLRRINLEIVPAKGSRARNSYYAYWTVHERWKVAQAGGDPKGTFAEKRRHWRATHKKVSASGDGPLVPPGAPSDNSSGVLP
jgi:hypothetical protein